MVTTCPSALAAAQALTGNNAQLPISNAAFSGPCTAGGIQAWLLITNFGCHYLASKMPLGELHKVTIDVTCSCNADTSSLLQMLD